MEKFRNPSDDDIKALLARVHTSRWSDFRRA